MKNKFSNFIIICFAFLATSSPIYGQQPEENTSCKTDEIYKRLLNRHPTLKIDQAQVDHIIQQQLTDNPTQLTDEVLTIPLVVHVIHRNGTPVGTAENLSDATIINLVNQTNDLYKHTSGSTFPNPHAGVDIGIQFCLAARDPHGNPTSGIDRHADDNLTIVNIDTSTDTLQKTYHWNLTEYYNVYLIYDLIGAGGFAYFAGSHGRYWDGTVMQYNMPADVWAHEFGHSLNLYHTFQGSNSQTNTCPTNSDCLSEGDRVCDTPPHVTNSCDLTINSCSTDEEDTSTNNPFRAKSLGGLGDMTDPGYNYMSYACGGNFTQGQKERMRAALTGTRSSYLVANSCSPLVTNDASIAGIMLKDTCKTSLVGAEIIIGNFGSANLTSTTVQLLVDDVVKHTINWTGNLDYGTFDTLSTPFVSTTFGNHTICARITNANNTSDENTTNNEICKAVFIDRYCTSYGEDDFFVYIDQVELGAINNTSGKNSGYANFTNLSTDLALGHPYVANLTTGYSGSKYNSRWYIYMDFNQDYDFTDPGELVYFISGVQDTHNASFSIPESVAIGSTRMRIINAFNSAASQGAYSYGETEDYTINIVDNGCYTYNTFPYSEGFENGLGIWSQEVTDSLDWRLDEAGTSSSNTGPSTAKEGTTYLYIEATNNTPNKMANIKSPCMDLSAMTNPGISFAYHMYGSGMGSLALQISTDEGNNWIELWSESGDQGDEWKTETIALANYAGQTVQLRFSGITGPSFRSDMAIDELTITGDVIQIPECQGTTKVLGTEVINSNNYVYSESIMAACKINTDNQVTFQAGTSVSLQSGFHAQAGSTFSAKIEACSTLVANDNCNLSLTPIIQLGGTEDYEVGGIQWRRYTIPVTNWGDIPPALFTAAPDLPACGTNTNAARTWVNIYNGTTNAYIYGFCALSSNSSLQTIWFAVQQSDCPPSSVYVVLEDRFCNKIYTSNTLSLDCNTGSFNFTEATRQINTTTSETIGALSLDAPMFALYPNPTQQFANIRLHIPSQTTASIRLTNLTGQEVQQVFTDRILTKGQHLFTVDTKNLIGGVYFVKVKIGQQYLNKKLVVLR